METQIMPQPQLVRTINAIDKTIFTVSNLLLPKKKPEMSCAFGVKIGNGTAV
jgi:hypothetical protein